MRNPNEAVMVVKGSLYLIPTYIVDDNGIQDHYMINVAFCKGDKNNPNKLRQPGVFSESLIAAVIMYLEDVNVGELKSEFTVEAISYLSRACELLNKRKDDRKSRGVQGTYKP